MSRPTQSWPRRLALVLLAVMATAQIANAVASERAARRSTLQGMGWVITNFPRSPKGACDPTSHHSPLALNITRPDRSTFCFKISYMVPVTNHTYSCRVPPNAGQVARVQLLTAPGCGDAVAGITVNGRAWSNYTYNSTANILSIDRIAALPPPDAANPSDHTVCIQLRPISITTNSSSGPANATTCGSVTSFCAPTYGPAPACAVLVADNKGKCCPVNRVSYANAEVAGGLLFNLYGKFNGPAGCDSISSPGGLQDSIEKQYLASLTELKMPRVRIQFLSYSCRVARMAAVFRATGLTMNTPELIAQRSAFLLKPLAEVLDLVGVRAVPYIAPSPSPLPPLPSAPQSPQRASPPPSAPPPLQPSPPPVPSHPNVPARAEPPRSGQSTPSHYASQPPPVYGVY